MSVNVGLLIKLRYKFLLKIEKCYLVLFFCCLICKNLVILFIFIIRGNDYV